MKDMTQVIVPKSDQWNADDFIGGSLTFRIADVAINLNSEQPVSIRLEGEQRVWRPCKSMSRVLVQGWGPDASKYVGRSLTLYRDASVKWGGMEVGGIRISHLSHIDGEKLMMLTATKGQRKPHKVKPLVDNTPPPQDAARKWADAYVAAVSKAETTEALADFANSKAAKLAELENKRPELHAECVHALDQRRAALSFDDDFPLSEDNPTAADGREDSDFGDQHDDTDAPAWAATVDRIKADIPAAQSKGELADIEAEYLKHAALLPKDVADEIEAMLAARKRALGK